MIDREHALPLSRQAALLKLSRSSLYYRARPVAPGDLAVMRRIDELHLDYPFAGSRMLRDLLRGEDVEIGRQRVAAMMKRMAIEAIYRRPSTSKPAPGNKIYPYLLRGLAVERPNQAWAMDITYIPMARGFVYLAAVVDWFSRRVLSLMVSLSNQARLDHDGGRVLPRGGRGGARSARPAGYFQYRPGQSVHQRRLDRPAARQRHRHQHGRQGGMARQRLRRAVVALGQIRGGLSQGL